MLSTLFLVLNFQFVHQEFLGNANEVMKTKILSEHTKP